MEIYSAWYTNNSKCLTCKEKDNLSLVYYVQESTKKSKGPRNELEMDLRRE